MGVSEAIGNRHFLGLSTDTKPTTDIMAGATFFETDTGRLFIYSGGAWVASGADGRTGSAIPAQATLIGASDGTNLQPLKVDAAQNIYVCLRNAGNTVGVGAYGNYDGNGASFLSLVTTAYGLTFNGVTWDRQRPNYSSTILASAARTASTNSADQTNYNGRGVRLSIDVTAVTGTASITVTIKSKDSVSGVYSTILASAAISTVSHVELTVYPGLPATANVSANAILSRTWRVEVTNANADSITYSVGADVML